VANFVLVALLLRVSDRSAVRDEVAGGVGPRRKQATAEGKAP